MMEDTLELGGNINLEGFSDIDSSKMIVIKKMVGNYVKLFSEEAEDFKGLKLVRNDDTTDSGHTYGIKAILETNGSKLQAEVCDGNIFFCIDNALKEIENRYRNA